MSSFPELGSLSAGPWFGGSSARRAVLALAVVFVLLATSGWTAIRQEAAHPGPRAAAVQTWIHSSIDGRKLPKPEAGQKKIKQFFASLTGTQRTSLADRHPLVVGNLAGAPTELRYRANHTAMQQARAVDERRAADERITELGREQARTRVERLDSLLRDGRQILAFDPTGGGRVAEVLGDLDRAQRVSTVVPGVDTDLAHFERPDRPHTAPAGMARSLYQQERAEKPGVRTAVVAWADYTAPEGVGMDAATGRMAEDGAVRLNAFVRSLPGSSQVALFCHSYGSVVCGVAADDLPARASDIAVAGSPGMRAQSARELGSNARIWATRDPGDWIRDVPNLEIGGLGHGADPVSAGFGARVMSANGAHGHGDYFAPGTSSLKNFARIGVGSQDSVRCMTGGACNDGLGQTVRA
ncbi:alpha/beta hydrolase [Streptomyces meridianus]|uniref:Alpha/beta hydrolase family protein n=1 Tax=Streptomyces meridianus TaxID=2938945 RepID=A0ABT0X698_9ACTN|nr:alpha/beta hydrolase [Streptomyces meridianus]MCM2578062.1 alpha/beta hydrolase family protein [Streptomyces meridianus]